MNIFCHLSLKKKRFAASARSFEMSFPQLSKRHWSVKAFKGAVRQIPVSQKAAVFLFFFFSFREFETAEQLEEMTDCRLLFFSP